MKLVNFLIVRGTFYLGQITLVESMLLTVIVGCCSGYHAQHWTDLTSVNVAEVGDVRHLLEEGQVEAAGLQQRPRLPDVDRLAPLSGRSVKDVNMRVAVHQQEAVGGGGDASGSGRVHDLHVPGLATPERIGQSSRCILLGE